MKISEYPAVTKLNSDNVFLVDGSSGTKRILVSDALLAATQFISVENRRRVFRGKNLGSVFTNTHKVAIQLGTFDDLWLGDYWEIGNVRWRIVDFNYWYNCGDTPLTKHHLVIMPDTALYNAAMNTSSVTTGGYIGSQMYKTNLANAKTTITDAFDDAVLTRREYLVNTVTSGYPSAGAWTNSSVELPNEPMIYGSYIYTPGNDGTTDVKRFTCSKTQLALFNVCPKFINGVSFWLRDVVSATHFARVDATGGATSTGAANSYGVRPVFAIG